MARNLIPKWFYLNLCLLIFLGFYDCKSRATPSFNSYIISSFSYPETKLKPYEWRYIRVDLPPWFSSMSIALQSDVDLDTVQVGRIGKLPKSTLPLVCFRDGSLPLPDFSDNALSHLALGTLSNGSLGAIGGVQNAEHCYPLRKTIDLILTNEQITPGVWYIGLFNGIGALRTQSKMISRGSAFSFAANVSVEGCTVPNLWGQFCNQTVESLSCSQLNPYASLTKDSSPDLYHGIVDDVIFCRNFEDSCQGDNETRVYSLEVVGMAEQLSISAADIRFNGTLPSNDTDNAGVVLMCYARYGAIALAILHDYSADLIKGSLTVPLPKAGRWYITIAAVNLTKGHNGNQDNNMRVCYSLAWQVAECPLGKAGFNCTWEIYTLQTVLRANPSTPFESYYLPLDGNVSSDSANFALEPLLRNSSLGRKLGVTWTYFVLDIPRGATGGNLHFKLKSDQVDGYEIYVRYGGLPSADVWDYYYINKTKSSEGSMFFTRYNSSKGMVDFDVLFAREGTWIFGLKQLNSTYSTSLEQTTISVSLERCPKRCSSPHGSCHNFVDQSGLTLYSYCSCDRTHGGFDCSIEIVTHRGHMWQSISLIASNAAAILPAYWALRKKAFAEWVIFTASGISSGLYHACDVGTWCALTFRVLQFMDFWLSFMAVVSTFVYLAAIDEASRRTIQAAVFILTAIMAISGATRSANIVLVIAIGTGGLLIGWLIELVAKHRLLPLPTGFCSSTLYRWHNIRTSLHSFVLALLKRYHWGFMLAGFTALAMAAISWKLETSQSYWIWHSIWHVSIYTSSFFFLCSKAAPVAVSTTTANPTSHTANYELTRQDSIPHEGE